jgi:hypothetical protein
MNVPEGALEDQPEQVIGEISRAQAEQEIARLRAVPKSVPQKPSQDISWADESLADSGAESSLKPAAPVPRAGKNGPNIMPGYGEPSRLEPIPSSGQPVAPRKTARPVPVLGEAADPFSIENPYAPQTSSAADVAVIHPSGTSAQDLYSQGMQLLRDGRREDAFAVFQQVYHSGQQLNSHDQQQLQDFLRELAPARGRNIRQVATQNQGEGAAEGPQVGATPAPATALRRTSRNRRAADGRQIRQAAHRNPQCDLPLGTAARQQAGRGR